MLLFLVLCRRGALRPAAFLAAGAMAYALLAPHLHDASLDDAETIAIELFIFGLAVLAARATLGFALPLESS